MKRAPGLPSGKLGMGLAVVDVGDDGKIANKGLFKHLRSSAFLLRGITSYIPTYYNGCSGKMQFLLPPGRKSVTIRAPQFLRGKDERHEAEFFRR